MISKMIIVRDFLNLTCTYYVIFRLRNKFFFSDDKCLPLI